MLSVYDVTWWITMIGVVVFMYQTTVELMHKQAKSARRRANAMPWLPNDVMCRFELGSGCRQMSRFGVGGTLIEPPLRLFARDPLGTAQLAVYRGVCQRWARLGGTIVTVLSPPADTRITPVSVRVAFPNVLVVDFIRSKYAREAICRIPVTAVTQCIVALLTMYANRGRLAIYKRFANGNACLFNVPNVHNWLDGKDDWCILPAPDVCLPFKIMPSNDYSWAPKGRLHLCNAAQIQRALCAEMPLDIIYCIAPCHFVPLELFNAPSITMDALTMHSVIEQAGWMLVRNHWRRSTFPRFIICTRRFTVDPTDIVAKLRMIVGIENVHIDTTTLLGEFTAGKGR